MVHPLPVPVGSVGVSSALLEASPVENGNSDPVTANRASGVQRIDGLLTPNRWSDGSISYSDPNAASDYGADHPEAFSNFSQFTARQMVAVHFALDTTIRTQPSGAAGFSVEGFAGLNVTYAGAGTGNATLRYANTSNPSTAYAYYPTAQNYGGDSFYGRSGDLPTAGNYDWHTIIHETGHALGLKHGHETGGFGAQPANRDSLEYSVMTYRTFIGDDTSGYNYETWGAPQTFMMDDIAALQHMYGADYSTNSGDTVYSWNARTGETYVDGKLAIDPGGNRIFQTIWDGGGNDTYDLSGYTSNLAVSLTPGGYSTFSNEQRAYLGGGPNGGYARGNVFNAFMHKNNPASLIENVVGGSGADNIRGNAAANRLDGGANADTLMGHLGNDTYIVDNIADMVIEAVGEGIDTVLASVSWVLAAAAEIEFLKTLSQPGTTAIALTGNEFAQTIFGNNGANILDGGGAADTMQGLAGNDTYFVDHIGDIVIEAVGDVADTVATRISYALAADAEIETLRTTSNGGTGAIKLTGNAFDQTIVGNNGANTLKGGGGLDTLSGLGGNDTYLVYTATDTIIETATGGARDKVAAGVSYTLSAGVHVEQMTTTSAGGTAAINLAGNEIGQTITGNAGANRLEGKGGADQLRGLGGADTFVFATKLGGGNVDAILDFSVPDDRFLLSDAIFTALDPGTLAASAFRANASGLADDDTDRIVYETDTGHVFYDADGSGAAAGIHFATITAGLALTNADFSVA
jgi:serralysin